MDEIDRKMSEYNDNKLKPNNEGLLIVKAPSFEIENRKFTFQHKLSNSQI